jgi:hypothetical protein
VPPPQDAGQRQLLAVLPLVLLAVPPLVLGLVVVGVGVVELL